MCTNQSLSKDLIAVNNQLKKRSGFGIRQSMSGYDKGTSVFDSLVALNFLLFLVLPEVLSGFNESTLVVDSAGALGDWI